MGFRDKSLGMVESPRTDDVSDELDLRKRYLFVKVIKVEPGLRIFDENQLETSWFRGFLGPQAPCLWLKQAIYLPKRPKDRVVTPDTRPTDEIDTFVEASLY